MTMATTFRIKLQKEFWVITNSMGKEISQPTPVPRKDKAIAVEFAKEIAFHKAPAVIEVFNPANTLDERIYVDPFRCLN